jgi:hypothetical protein
MNPIRNLVLVLTLGASWPALALQAEQHQSHHPQATAPAPANAATPADPAKHSDHAPASEAPAVDAQIAAMHAMHEKLMAAKSPAERKARMAEHDRMMRDGMKSMEAMSQDHGAGGCDMAKRMEMMQAMMQLMMDRLPNDTK